MDWVSQLDTAAFGALLCAASGVLVPRIIERVPEPEPEDAAADRAPHAAQVDAPERTTDTATAKPAEPRFEGGAEEVTPPKELYYEIAERPGLVWRSVLAGAIVGGLVGMSLGWDWALLVWLPLVPVCLALSAIDWRTRLLPTWLIRRGYVLAVLLAVVATLLTQDWDDLVRAGIGCVAATLLFYVLWFVYPRGMGFGDVRLSGILGILLGYVGTPELVVGLYAGFLFGGLGGALLAMLRIVHRKAVPFGPFMLAGGVAGLLIGDWLATLTS
jgi:leader peptidase (prepilin peptidase)/N-methyltransferase